MASEGDLISVDVSMEEKEFHGPIWSFYPHHQQLCFSAVLLLPLLLHQQPMIALVRII
jgi:hypothetical protein